MGLHEHVADSATLPLTEPEICPCLYLSGVKARLEHGVVVITGWQETEDELRICIRFAVPRGAMLNAMTKLGVISPHH